MFSPNFAGQSVYPFYKDSVMSAVFQASSVADAYINNLRYWHWPNT